jgi:hypothetical protein
VGFIWLIHNIYHICDRTDYWPHILAITGGEAVATLLEDNHVLQVCPHLSGWTVQDIAQLMLLTVLQELNLSWNYIREESALAIGRAIRHNHGLTKLDVSYNTVSVLSRLGAEAL